jgi:DNA-binding transcriptional ArsR family regulator
MERVYKVKQSDSKKIARILKILSVESRVRMLGLLKSRPLCVNALADILGITPAAVSQHLRILRDSGVLKAEKRGYFVHYSVDKKIMENWKKITESLLNEN